MSKFKFTINGKNYEVTVTDKDTNLADVEVNGTSYTVQYEPQTPVASAPVRKAAPAPAAAAAAAPASAPTPAPAAAGAGAIVAPLPGTVTNVAVSVGASVKRGDLLLVMEAMKMENDIRSDRDGVIKSVYVAAGKTVMQGDPLVEIG